MNLTHYIKLKLLRHSLACLALVTCSATLASAAVTWHDIQFGGFASQGFIANTGNNDYLGETSKGTFDFREYAVNSSYSTGQFRVGAQAFGQKLGDYGDDKIKLDWATIDYQPAQWFGLRVGRVKTPRGLYNEALDVDSVRPFVLLPQSVYDARLRDFNSAFNGGMLFGNVGIGHAGSLDYRAYYGDIPLSTSSGASDYFNNDAPIPNAYIGMDYTVGGSLFWNTPVQGLRTGYSFTRYNNFGAGRSAPAGGPPGAPNLIIDRTTPNYDRHLLSVEYIKGDWTFAGEAGEDTATYTLALPSNVAGNGNTQDFTAKYAYISAARRFTPRFEAGSYVSYSYDVITGIAPMNLKQLDYALSAHFDINDHLLVKAEVHYMDGSGKLFNTATHAQPIEGRDNSWVLFAVKTTLSF